jgi:hypothetical protein
MGQAVADLPDPLEMPPPASLAGTDDLLSQIAGDEIDRLMAEADGGGSAPAFGSGAPSAAPVSSSSDELTALLDQLNDEPAKPQATVAASAQDSPTPSAEAHHAVAPAFPAIAHEAEALMSTAERDALGLSNLSDATDAAEHQDATHPVIAEHNDETATATRPGLVIRLLEGVNAPLAFVPDAARDAIGKLAIITLANSVAVLVYVLLFRR